MAGFWKTDAESAEKGAEDAEKATAAALRVFVPQPSGDQAPSGWGTRGFGVAWRRTGNGKSRSLLDDKQKTSKALLPGSTSCGGLGHQEGADKWGDAVFTLNREARFASETKPLVSGMKVKEPRAEGDEVPPIADVLYEKYLSRVSEDTRGLEEEFCAASRLSDFVGRKEQEQCVAVASPVARPAGGSFIPDARGLCRFNHSRLFPLRSIINPFVSGANPAKRGPDI
jgi:hypothetical protein